MADFDINVVALGSNDEVQVFIGTTPGASDVLSVTYNATGLQMETFTPTAATLYLDVRGYDNLTDAHNITIDDISITDGIERLTNGDFGTGDLTGWTDVTGTNTITANQDVMTGFGGPADPTTIRQSFATSFVATASTGANAGGCLEWLGYEMQRVAEEARTAAERESKARAVVAEAKRREAEFAEKYAGEIDAYIKEVERLDAMANLDSITCEFITKPTGTNVMESRALKTRNVLQTRRKYVVKS